MNSGAVADKTVASNRSADGQSGIKTVIKYAYAPCSMIAAGKKRDVEAQPLPDLIWSEDRCANQKKIRTFFILPDSRALP